MDKNSINFILDNYKGVRRDRWLKLFNNTITPEEHKKLISCEIVRTRRDIIDAFKKLKEYGALSHKAGKIIKMYEQDDITQAAEYVGIKADIDKAFNSYEKYIAHLGQLMMFYLEQNLFTEHEICQLLHCNTARFNEQKQMYLKHKDNDESKKDMIFKIISVYAAEYRTRRGQCPGFYDCEYYEMPIYWSLHFAIMDFIDNNKEAKQASNKMLKEIFPDVKPFTLIEDMEGNVVGLKQVEW